MFDTVFYLKLTSGVGFILASFFIIREYKINPKRYKCGLLPAIGFFLAGILQLISALTY
jgi:xanthine/uracil/vitamin C permease (AzgA family)